MIRPDATKLRLRVRQLILMRETGPKSAAWHMARMRLIWNLHDRIKQAEELPDAGRARDDEQDQPTSII